MTEPVRGDALRAARDFLLAREWSREDFIEEVNPLVNRLNNALDRETRVRELEEALRHLLTGGAVRMNGRDYALFGIEAYLPTGGLVPAPDGPLGRLAEAQAEVLDIDWDALRGEYAALTEAAATEEDTDD